MVFLLDGFWYSDGLKNLLYNLSICHGWSTSWMCPKLRYRIPFLFQYVDDLANSVARDKVDDILTVFNAFRNFIQFIVEREYTNWVPFLVMKVIRDVVILDSYQKPTSSVRYMNYYNCQEHMIKINPVRSNWHYQSLSTFSGWWELQTPCEYRIS